MAETNFGGEVPVNYEQKCPCILVLDTSGSMTGDPINELNEGLKRFHQEIQKDTTASSRLEIEIIRFDSTVETVQQFALTENFSMPHLNTRGSTKLADGVRKGIKSVESRKTWYKETGQTYYRPYIILITDGGPDSDQDINGLANEINNGVENKRFNFWSFGVEGADMNILEQLSHPNFKPLKLKGVDFVKFFKWLSASMTAITNSMEGDKVDIKPKSDDENPFQFTV